jgi:hypothetical protein
MVVRFQDSSDSRETIGVLALEAGTPSSGLVEARFV